MHDLTAYTGIRLDIGCGANKQPGGFFGIDMRDLPGVDLVWDIEEIPWPLPDECALQAICSHVVEHINPHKFKFLNFMDEVWRILKYDAQFAIACPHGASPGFLQDPTHCNALNETTWSYMDPLCPHTGGALYRIYRPKPWKILSLDWNPSANIEVILSKRREDASYDSR